MTTIAKHYSRNDLPFTSEMISFWNDNGFIIIDNFYSHNECDKLRSRTAELVKDFDYSFHKTIVNSKEKQHANDSYFLGSGDKVRFFFEKDAFDQDGNIVNSIELVLNKIGHAMHDLDHVFFEFVHRKDLDDIAKAINIKFPKLLQSMYIFKQPRIGGEVICHQDSTFLYTEPESTVGFWVALEDANVENGCMWTSKGGHKGPLRHLWKRTNNDLKMETLDETPFGEMDTILEVKKGSLIMLHGRLPHYSCENTSNQSRHAYTFHVIDGHCTYPKFNWLQRSKSMPLKGFLD